MRRKKCKFDTMIKANELRIGNYVFVGQLKDKYYRVDIISSANLLTPLTAHQMFESDDKAKCIHVEGNGVYNSQEQLHGIPLTPELLEQCGFKNGIIRNFEKGVKMSVGDDTAYIGDLTSTSGAGITGIKYLHQLQNLYFALTGEELTVNL
jgi:hypothetical protein